MIDRYCTLEMARIWSEGNKIETWLKVEEAIIQAKEEMGLLPTGTAQQIESSANFLCDKFLLIEGKILELLSKMSQEDRISLDLFERLSRTVSGILSVERIREIEQITKHDMLAFIQTVQESLPENLRQYFHKDVTSYDIEEPALALLIAESIEVIFKEMTGLVELLRNMANEHRDLVRIERSHGQHAEPNTLGLLSLFWYGSLARQMPFLDIVQKQIKETKISGAIGTYTGNLSPQLEERALAILGLESAAISMQIVLRDRHAHVINVLAVIAGVLENIALQFRLLGQTEICEIQEPFGKGQKGSSRMPHKKNPILSENLCGLARIVRHNAGIALENIPTWGGRDISHSSAERVIFPDCFNLVHFMLKRMRKILGGIVINRENIERNLNSTLGVIFSPEVKDLLMEEGTDPELAYQIAQETAFEAIEGRKNYLDVLLQKKDLSPSIKERLKDLFRIENKLKHVNEIFGRFGL